MPNQLPLSRARVWHMSLANNPPVVRDGRRPFRQLAGQTRGATVPCSDRADRPRNRREKRGDNPNSPRPRKASQRGPVDENHAAGQRVKSGRIDPRVRARYA
jgi:hypothetical protein